MEPADVGASPRLRPPENAAIAHTAQLPLITFNNAGTLPGRPMIISSLLVRLPSFAQREFSFRAPQEATATSAQLFAQPLRFFSFLFSSRLIESAARLNVTRREESARLLEQPNSAAPLPTRPESLLFTSELRVRLRREMAH